MLVTGEVENLLSEHMSGEWGEWHYAKGDAAVMVDGLGLVEVVDVEGNSEGGGEYSHIVFLVTHSDDVVRYYKVEGCYQSYNGCEWDGPFLEVTPERKTVTVYDRV